MIVYSEEQIKQAYDEGFEAGKESLSSSRPLCEVLSDRTIEQVAADECQNIDADSLEIRDVYYDGFVAGAKWAREKAKNFA